MKKKQTDTLKAVVVYQIKNIFSDRTISKYLHTLTQSGTLQRQGAGRGTFYALPDKPNPAQ